MSVRRLDEPAGWRLTAGRQSSTLSRFAMSLGTNIPWLDAAIATALIVAVGYVAGRVARAVLGSRVAKLAGRTAGGWDDIVVEEVLRRVPLWATLAAVYVAAGQWELPVRAATALDQALFVALVLSLTLTCATIAGRLTTLYGSTLQPALPVTSLTENIARIVVVTLGVLIVLNRLGVSITPILTALGVGGIAVALALQDTLANLFAGFYIVLAGQIRVGDYVTLDSGQEGYVVDIAWRATRLRMLPNNVVLVPNAKLGQAIVTNYNLPDKELAVLVQVGVDYDSDLAHVERVTIDVARDVMRTVTGGVPTFEPFVRYHTFGQSSIDFSVIMRGGEFVDQYLIKHEFVKRLHAAYGREGITIPWPIRTVAFRNPERSADPAKTRDAEA